MGITEIIKSNIGFLRSYLIYLTNPLKRRRISRFYASFISPGDLCFDVGAHAGIQSMILDSLGAKVIAIEPNPVFYKFLQNKFRKRPNIIIIPKAIADMEMEQPMYISRIAPTVSTLANDEWRTIINDHSSFEVSWDEQISVKTTTLDALIKEFGVPRFIKLDIEDYEWKALKALHLTPDYISFEFFSYLPDRVVKCVEEIEKNGVYEYNFSIAETFNYKFPAWKNAMQLKEWINSRDPSIASGDIYARRKSK